MITSTSTDLKTDSTSFNWILSQKKSNISKLEGFLCQVHQPMLIFSSQRVHSSTDSKALLFSPSQTGPRDGSWRSLLGELTGLKTMEFKATSELVPRYLNKMESQLYSLIDFPIHCYLRKRSQA